MSSWVKRLKQTLFILVGLALFTALAPTAAASIAAGSCSSTDRGEGMCKFECEEYDWLWVKASSTDDEAKVRGSASCGGAYASCGWALQECKGESRQKAGNFDTGDCEGESSERWPSDMTVECWTHSDPPEEDECWFTPPVCDPPPVPNPSEPTPPGVEPAEPGLPAFDCEACENQVKIGEPRLPSPPGPPDAQSAPHLPTDLNAEDLASYARIEVNDGTATAVVCNDTGCHDVEPDCTTTPRGTLACTL